MTPLPWHFTTWLDLLDHWQTGIAGFLAFAAGLGTVVATMLIARRQIHASREEADRVIAATRAQTAVAQRQIETTIDLARMRAAGEAEAFRAVLEAAMTRVLAEAAWVKKTYPDILTPKAGVSDAVGAVRRCFTKGAFAELRGACVRQGSPLTGELLDLEREIDSFAAQGNSPAGLTEQLALIETKAAGLREKAFERFSGSVAAPGPFAPAEAEALIGAPAPAEPAPRRSLLRYWFGWKAAG